MLTDSTAREASGGDITDSTGGMDDDSPTVVRQQVDLDDSF
jgi:DASH complex subunit ASK1